MCLALMLTLEACMSITSGVREGRPSVSDAITHVILTLGLSSFLLINVMLALIGGKKKYTWN